MSYHVLTIEQHGAFLSVDRGFLVCTAPETSEKRMPLADVRAVVVSVPSVGFTNQVLARLLEQNSMVLHCNTHYKPVGWTAPLERVVRKPVFENQLAATDSNNTYLWQAIIKQKMRNQAQVLDTLGIEHDLNRLIEKSLPNEANVARQYWGHYFTALQSPQRRERKGADSFENKALNYGYAVISTLVHRAILIHGLLPLLGLHHQVNYQSHPLVYDLMEPFRPFVDLSLAYWCSAQHYEYTDDDFKAWIRYFMPCLRQWRIQPDRAYHSYKWVDGIDQMVQSVASCFQHRDESTTCNTPLWLPKVAHLTIETEDKGEQQHAKATTQKNKGRQKQRPGEPV